MASARDNFVRLAESRTQKLLKDFDLLGNLSNRSNYSYSEDDVKLIFRAIAKKVQETELRFKMNIQSGRDSEFRLPR
jgi:hypothetical protein